MELVFCDFTIFIFGILCLLLLFLYTVFELKNWCDTHVHSNGNDGSPTGPTMTKLPASTLTQKQS